MRAFRVWIGLVLFAVGAVGETLTFEDGGTDRVWKIESDGQTLTPAGREPDGGSPRKATRRVRAMVVSEAAADTLAARTGAAGHRRLAYAPGWYVFEYGTRKRALAAVAELRRLPGTSRVAPVVTRPRPHRAAPNDPLFPDQWHLLNAGRKDGLAGVDLNVVPAWEEATGEGVTIGVVDNGASLSHPDLAGAIAPPLGYDFFDGDPDSGADFFDKHGTACAGLAAAEGDNGLGVAGVAYGASLAVIRLVVEGTDDVQEADAFAWKQGPIAVKTNSWGPPDFGREFEGPGPLAAAALADAARNGRGGKGTVFVWSAGNGRRYGDDVNRDGYANSPYTLAVSAVSDRGKLADYSEPGAPVLVCAPSSSRKRQAITTTDLPGLIGYKRKPSPEGDFTNTFGGTSASAPMVAGVVALMLEKNPALGWRDVQEILVRTARRVDAKHPDWQANGAGLYFNHRYGAGLVDAAAAVAMSGTWVNLGPQVSAVSETEGVPLTLGSSGQAEFVFPAGQPGLRIERVRLYAEILHPNRGDLDVRVVSPSGKVSRMLRPNKDASADVDGWTFSSVHHWGEMADAGSWRVLVRDRAKGGQCVVRALRLEFLGVATAGLPELTGLELVSESGPANGRLDEGESVAVAATIRNGGATAMAGATGTLLESGGAISPGPAVPLGDLMPGASGTGTFTFTVGAECGRNVAGTIEIGSAGGPAGAVRFALPIGPRQTGTFSNPSPITIPFTSAKAVPYPSQIAVSGMGGAVVSVRLVLKGLTLDYSEDLDLMLVSPAGTAIVPMSDLGSGPCTGVDLTLDSAASSRLPYSSPLSSGTFRPQNAGTKKDVFPFPAPKASRGGLERFVGENPNGTWKLFVADALFGDSGSIAGGWAVEIVTAPCAGP